MKATVGPNFSAATFGVFVKPVEGGFPDDRTLTGRLPAPNIWQACAAALCRLRRLKDDWDGEGSVAPAPEKVDAALRLVMMLQGQANGQLPPPTPSAGPNGELLLVWEFGEAYLEAQIVAAGRIDWMEIAPGRDPKHFTTSLPLQTAAAFRGPVAWAG